jgi:hypothetical protein
VGKIIYIYIYQQPRPAPLWTDGRAARTSTYWSRCTADRLYPPHRFYKLAPLPSRLASRSGGISGLAGAVSVSSRQLSPPSSVARLESPRSAIRHWSPNGAGPSVSDSADSFFLILRGEIWQVGVFGPGPMAVASRLAVARVSPDGAGRRGRPGLAAGGRRRGGAVAASPPTEEAVQMTEPLTKDHLVAYLVSGCKPKENWRSEDSIRSPLFFLFLRQWVALILPYW